MSHNQPLLSSQIEPDSNSPPSSPFPSGNIGGSSSPAPARPTLSTGNSGLPAPVTQGNSAQGGQEEGVVAMLRRSSHPMILVSLYLFRSLAIAVYVLMGLFTSNYILSIVIVVVLLSVDFWNTRNVCGRTLVGLRYWNQVDEDGESAWVFESRDPSIPANPVDSKLFWTALYAYPVGWAVLFFVSLLKFSVSYLPIVALALVFNLSNVLGFTYADRDAKQRWASTAMGSSFGLGSLGGLGGQLVGGAMRNGLGRVLGR